MLQSLPVSGDLLLLVLGTLLLGSAAVIATAVAVAQVRSRRSLGHRLRLDPDGGRVDGARARKAEPPAVPTMFDRAVAKAAELVRDGNPAEMKKLRLQLIRAGVFDQRAPVLFVVSRFVVAGLGFGAMMLWFVLSPGGDANPWVWSATTGMASYFIPNFVLSRRAKRVAQENRSGFPDLMDLLGVCSNAGLSMEAGLERVARELADLFPVLGVHLQILCLEVRAGRPLEEALNGLADRTNITEVRAFATLLQQSKELGSSLADALRVFSEDMRHKRLSAAEEKAYALPAKMSGVVTACILPVVIFVAILPVIVRFKTGAG